MFGRRPAQCDVAPFPPLSNISVTLRATVRRNTDHARLVPARGLDDRPAPQWEGTWWPR